MIGSQMDVDMMAAAMTWAWCALFHRKHHEHIGRFRECHKCITRDSNRAKARKREPEHRQLEADRAAVRSMFEAPNRMYGFANGKAFRPESTSSRFPPLNQYLEQQESDQWPEIIE